jgi:hypothetical protein
MKSENLNWSGHSLLSYLRPHSEQKVRLAILSSYSADLSTLGAVLLALAGRDRDDGRGNRAALADAFDALKNKTRFLIQRGRLAKHKQNLKIAAIFDRLIKEVPWDESERSWHPKIALINYIGNDGVSSWRLWLGSKNLTRAFDLEEGLMIHGEERPGSRSPIEGVDDLAQQLAAMAALPNVEPTVVAKALASVKWKLPTGVKINWIRLKLSDVENPYFNCPDKCDKLYVISPFLDGDIVGQLGAWGKSSVPRRILATQSHLRKLAIQKSTPLRGFSAETLGGIHVANRPEREPGDAQLLITDGHEEAATVDEEEDLAPLGVHAKIIAIGIGARARLWVGSANATRRWITGNAEVIAEIEGSSNLLAGLETLMARYIAIGLDELKQLPELEEDNIEKRLEDCRQVIAARLNAGLSHKNGIFQVTAELLPPIYDPAMTLQVGLATAELVLWRHGETSVSLGSVALELQTTLVRFRLTLDGMMCEWLQSLPITPELASNRDESAIAAYMGAEHFLKWAKLMLRNEVYADDSGDPPWDEGEDDDEPSKEKRVMNEVRKPPMGVITIEDILASWAKNPATFKQTSIRLQRYLGAIAKNGKLTAAQQDELQRLYGLWQLVVKTLEVV